MSFDAKNFDRSKIIHQENPTDPDNPIKLNKGFFTPLGAGVLYKNPEVFSQCYYQTVQSLAKDFKISISSPFYASSFLKKELGLSKAIPFCDKLVAKMADFIDLIHISYVILPPTQRPTVCVGGNKCPEITMSTIKFLRDLAPMFSYISAWNFVRRHRHKKYDLHIDSFRSKHTIAWDELIKNNSPQIFPRGDECNPFISFSDIIAFLTDVKLYTSDPAHRQLTKENVEYVWKDYNFDVDCHYLDDSIFSKYKWYNNELIDIRPYLAHPIVFLLIDQIEQFDISPKLSIDQTTLPGEKKKFKEVLQGTAPYFAALKYAHHLDGSVQFFDRYVDSDKIKDGDVFVYMGDVSKKIATTFADGFDVEVLQLRELRKKIENL